MKTRSLEGRAFATRFMELASPVWEPLEAVAHLVRSRVELPAFHEGEFMYMATVRRLRRGLRIHLYKHVDTRCYLNLDDGGHAYAYRGPVPGGGDPGCGGRYQRYRSLVHAIEHLDLWLFEVEPAFARSFPPAASAPGEQRGSAPSAGFEPATHGLGNRCSIP
jgi:hypothetical protein